ncbi:hypothetical protein [Pendulispora albinea]|uniref:Uncharacterized protein n=1 Tax=Pendulispora albinea TaxID=2741071 RepID=A0ABZ2MA64_9BACT
MLKPKVEAAMGDDDVPNDPGDPPRQALDGPAPIARTGEGLGHHNTIVLGIFSSKRISALKIIRATFKSDHHVMVDNWLQSNQQDPDWSAGGQLLPKPDWVFGKPSAPISHSKGVPIEVEIVFEVQPPDAQSVPVSIKGKGTGSAALQKIAFDEWRNLVGGNAAVSLTGPRLTSAPDVVARMSGDIAWDGLPSDVLTRFAAGASWGHTIFVAIDTPMDAGNRETGITHRRMAASIELVQSTGAHGTHEIVQGLMRKLPAYTLDRDPAVPDEYRHPTYFNAKAGAWPLAQFLDKKAECQAIVRFVRAVMLQVGSHGTFEAVIVYSKPFEGKGDKAFEGPLPLSGGGLTDETKMVDGEEWHAMLIDRPVQVGKTYTNAQAGANNYEACLKVTADLHGQSKTLYYGGGTTAAFETADDVLRQCFWGLCWVHFGIIGFTVKAIVKKYAK